MATKRPRADDSSPEVSMKHPKTDEHKKVPLTVPSESSSTSSQAYIALPAIVPTVSSVSTNQQPPSSLNVPSGIIPLGSTHHHNVASSQSYPVTHVAALANLSASLSRSVDTQSLITPTTAVVIPTPLVPSVTPILPCTPPPPYSTSEVTDEFSCSSPSQFLHSPNTIQTTSPLMERRPSSPDKLRVNDDTKSLQMKILNLKRAKEIELKVSYEKMLQEKFFLEGGGNMMDYQVWRKKPNILKDQYLKQNDLDSDILVFEELLSPRDPSQIRDKLETEALLEEDTSIDMDTCSFSRQSASADVHSSNVVAVTVSQASTNNSLYQPSTPASNVTSPSHSLNLSSPRPALRMHSTLSSVPDVSHEDIVMRARHEAEVMKAISELRKEGMWSASRLPKVQEPSRIKTHWDYLLEEMNWLATDFANERRWKINTCKKLCRTVARHHQEQEQLTERAIKEEQLRLKKIASTLAKEVRHFWDSIQKIVEHKHHVILEEKRRQARDVHLNYIVDQTQKYSTWLMQGLNPLETTDPSLTSTGLQSGATDDTIFTPVAEDGSDDEETIDYEEVTALKEGGVDYETEISQLLIEGEMPLTDLIASIPGGALEDRSTEDHSDTEVKSPAEEMDCEASNDDDYSSVSDGDDPEDETTIAEQEAFEETDDHSQEISMLEEEGKLPVEELLRHYMQSKSDSTFMSDVETDYSGSYGSHDEFSDNEEVGDDDLGLESLVYFDDEKEEIGQTEQGFNDAAAAAEQFQPKGTTLSTTEVKTKVPFLLRHELREYQQIGLDWLVAMNERRLNGILADEMGLGKTIQTIALLAHLACEKAVWGPHLIIVPTSVILNWEFEFKKWCPGFKILTYIGTFKERRQKRVGWSRQNSFHVCITSYNIAVQDHRAFKQKRWRYLILDEAQNIKNFKSQRWQTLLTFSSQHRLLLTGTPLQNNLMELWSLMHFLMPTVFSSHSDFREWFSNPLTGMVEGSQEYNESIVERLHKVLRPFILRRLKVEVEKQLPSKYEHVILCKLSKRQRFLYEEYMSRAKTKETLSAGSYLSVINVLMQLRKVCNHPDLFELRPVASPFCMAGIVYATASMVVSALSCDPFKYISMDNLNLNLASNEQTLDAFVAYRSRQLQAPRSAFQDLNSHVCEDGHIDNNLVTMEERCHPWVDLVDSLSDREKIMRDTLHRINSFRCRKQPMYGEDMRLAVLTTHMPKINFMKFCQYSWLWTGYLFCQLQQVLPAKDLILCSTQALRHMLVSYDNRMAGLHDVLKRFLLTVWSVSAPAITLHTSHPDPSNYQKDIANNKLLYLTVSQIAGSLYPVSVSFKLQFPETRLIQYDCGKLQTLDLLLRRLRTEGHRVLIFTQMSRMLDILEIFLTFHAYTYLRLDGATPVQRRQLLMEQFNKDSRVFCFILSTRSGGLGVNLTGADTVIFYDSDWNPTMDAQAQDRCHRIGQTRDVHIYRLICQRTVEENILKKASQKRLLGDLAIESGGFTTDFFRKSNLSELFHVDTSQDIDLSGKDDAITSEELEELLLQAEEDRDVKAAEMARAEQVAEKAEFDELYLAQSDSIQTKDEDIPRSIFDDEFSHLSEQLSGVEQYAMRLLELESLKKVEQLMREAEENIEIAKKEWELGHLQRLREEEEKVAQEELIEEGATDLTYDRPELINKLWLPPTPPSDELIDHYVDIPMEMLYDATLMGPDSLSNSVVYSDEDYDVFGLHKVFCEPKPTRKMHKGTTKFKRENISYPQSLFWRRYTPDVMSTRIRKLSPQSKKDGPDWLSFEDWILIRGLTSALELPLFLNTTVPAQMPNWTILADFVTSLGKTKRSAVQCKDRIVGVLIPREEQAHRVNPQNLKNRRDHRPKSHIIQDKGKESTSLFEHCFHWILKGDWKSKHQSISNSSDGSPRCSMHNELLQKEYDITYGFIQCPTSLAQSRAERIQSEMPRSSSQMHQILSQAPVYNMPVARANVGKPFVSPDPMKPFSNSIDFNHTNTTAAAANVSRSSAVSSVSLTQRMQSTSTCISSLSSETFLQTSCTGSSTPIISYPIMGKAGQFPSSTVGTISSVPVTSSSSSVIPSVPKSYSSVDISKGLFLGQRLTQQQLLLLKQTALQQQQQQFQQKQQTGSQISPTTIANVLQRQGQHQHSKTYPKVPASSPSIQLPAKLQIPGIEQLRSGTIALPNQRVSSTLVRAGLPARSMQTDEVLALLRQQQALRLAMQNQTATKLSQQIATSQAGINEALAVAAMAAALKPSGKASSTESLRESPEQSDKKTDEPNQFNK
ncbi:PREDICTED: helicase domino-like isoform X2 [Amphimedon queenslandica]|uniref:Helicase domino n=1 Tax=Amphimedon queenslandica TaxID=400682 RepID=A0AAN0J606_AMPQE|nr:PREDICTED: helicase domino-like isoform X2 [Amphimedon queenslandica]|eukprot:XP_019852163.1 PREDICTED: helicase domino-like isoform X2 [Amphimedon queenslandica]